MTKWDEKYLRGENLSAEPHPLVARFAESARPGRALDLACGVGRNSIHLAKSGWSVTAVDSSKIAGEVLADRASAAGVEVQFVQADLETREFLIAEEKYDLIVDCFYLQRDLFYGIKAGLVVGGHAICVIPLIDDSPEVRPMNPDYLMQPGELKSIFHGWELLHWFEGSRPESGHRRAVAEIVARKI